MSDVDEHMDILFDVAKKEKKRGWTIGGTRNADTAAGRGTLQGGSGESVPHYDCRRACGIPSRARCREEMGN